MSGQEPLEPWSGQGAVLGPYRLLRRLGASPHAEVFEVEPATGAGRMALKLFPADGGVGVEVVAKMFRQTERLLEVDNPHVVAPSAFLQSDSLAAGGSGIVREVIEGRSLAQLIADEGPLSPERSIAICAQILDGLRAAHAAQVIHGNFKPENVFLTAWAGTDDYVKLVDFGRVNAPAAGEPLDVWTDLSAFGEIVYRMVSGRGPFPARASSNLPRLNAASAR